MFLGVPLGSLSQIVLHLGNGASASAVKNGKPIDTSMGLTPLEGLMMGTRTGDIDPAVVFHLQRVAGMSVDEVDTLFNKKSGMKGMTGESDMRSVWGVINNTSDPSDAAQTAAAGPLSTSRSRPITPSDTQPRRQPGSRAERTSAAASPA